MELIFRHSWLFLVFATSLNAFTWWFRGRAVRAEHPERTSSYNRMLVWLLFAGNLPWLILGGGVLFGGFILPLDPIILSEMNAWGWAFWLCIPFWSIGLVLYVFVFGGAEELSKHPGLINIPIAWQTPNVWRLIVIALFVLQVMLLPTVWMNKGHPAFAYEDWMTPANQPSE